MIALVLGSAECLEADLAALPGHLIRTGYIECTANLLISKHGNDLLSLPIVILSTSRLFEVTSLRVEMFQ